jgi:deoxyribonuclease V
LKRDIKISYSRKSLIRNFRKIVAKRDIRGAINFQKSLSNMLVVEGDPVNIKSTCAFDVSYDKNSKTNFGAAVVMAYPDMEPIESVHLLRRANFPYVPGLLAFREGSIVIEIYKKLSHEPGLLIFDGHGIAHPRGMGIASLIGILLDKPAIGCAKSRLIGEYKEPGRLRGSFSDLKEKGCIIGKVLRSRDNVKPIFVSIGHRLNVDSATGIILNCCRKYRIPEPIRWAHKLANEIRLKSL